MIHFDFGYKCGKRDDIQLICPALYSFDQCIPLGCPRIEYKTCDNTQPFGHYTGDN